MTNILGSQELGYRDGHHRLPPPAAGRGLHALLLPRAGRRQSGQQ